MVDILLIEDNEELAEVEIDFLAQEGYTIHHSTTGEYALDFIKNNNAKIILLDLMLPDIDGFAICKKIRSIKNLPIIMVSAHVSKESKISSLSYGADDYIEKPFDIDVLIAKIKAHLRRNYNMGEDKNILNDGNITIDLDAKTLYVDNIPKQMTIKEYELLLLLMQNKNKILNKDWIFDQVWGNDSFSEPSTLNVHINKIRSKIEQNPKEPKKIITMWGVGYKYEEV